MKTNISFLLILSFFSINTLPIFAQSTNISNTLMGKQTTGYGYSTQGSWNSFFGSDAGTLNTGNRNTFIGSAAGKLNTSGYDNSFLGNNAGMNNTTGFQNTFVGSKAGLANTTGNYNTATGGNALYSNSAGANNTANGFKAMEKNTVGSNNTVNGYYAGYYNQSGGYNLFSGSQAGYNNTTASYNAFLGYQAGFANNTGYNNSFMNYAGYRNTTGHDNAFLGYNAGSQNVAGSNNTSVGSGSGAYNNGNHNVFMGINACHYEANGVGNVAIGSHVGYNYSGSGNVLIGQNAAGGYPGTSLTGNNNVLIGKGSYVLNSGLSNATAIGYNAKVATSNSLVLGGTGVDAVNVGIGTTSPAAQLHTTSTVRHANLAQADNLTKFLVTDANGNVAWRDGSTIAPAQCLEYNNLTGVLSISGCSTTVTIPIEIDADTTNELQNLYINGDTLFISKGNYLILPQQIEIDADTTNELQTLAINGDTLFISKGNYLILPQTSTNDWHLTGNTGTNPSNNFIGTTDLQPLIVKTNGLERMRFTATTAGSPSEVRFSNTSFQGGIAARKYLTINAVGNLVLSDDKLSLWETVPSTNIMKYDYQIAVGTFCPPVNPYPANYSIYAGSDGILTTGLKVANPCSNINWADDEFDAPQMSIAELATYIQKNKHLPDMYSAAEVNEKGIDV